jgi:hypothetical protein
MGQASQDLQQMAANIINTKNIHWRLERHLTDGLPQEYFVLP